MKAPAKPKPPRDESVVKKRQAFADAVMEGKSSPEAARIAGYHPVSAQSVMRTEDVQEALKKARSELENVTTLKRLDVLNLFVEAIDMARTIADPVAMIRGATEIGKMMGYYEPEKISVELTGNQSNLQNKLRQLSDEDLLKIAAGQARVIDGEVERLQ